MDDLISRQALLDDFGFSEKTRKWGGDHSGYNTMMLYEIQNVIESAPSVNPQPCEDAISRQAVDVLVDELARAISDERCCMSRGRSTATIMQDILDLPSVKPQERTGYISIDDAMSVFDDFMCGEVDEDGTDTFLEMLKDKAGGEDKDE